MSAIDPSGDVRKRLDAQLRASESQSSRIRSAAGALADLEAALARANLPATVERTGLRFTLHVEDTTA